MPSHPAKSRTVALKFQQQNCLEQLGFTAAGTAPDLHRIPYYAVSPKEKQTPIDVKDINSIEIKNMFRPYFYNNL